MLIDDGLARTRERRLGADRRPASVAVPPTIQALLAARLDRLEPDERAVVERAAVEGKVFHRGAVAELVGRRDPPRRRCVTFRPSSARSCVRPDHGRASPARTPSASATS